VIPRLGFASLRQQGRYRRSIPQPSGVIFLGVGLVSLVLISSACDSSPSEKYARLIEQSAAWAAAGQYAEELRQQRYVPDPYIQDLIAAGSLETGQLHQPLNHSQDVSPVVRDRASALNDQLWQQFDTAAHTGHLDVVRLQQLYTALRALADSVRAAR
jgi:hypothetical protein